MNDEEEFFEVVDDGKSEVIDVEDIVHPELIKKLKDNRDEMMQIYAKVILNPYMAPQLLDDTKRNLMNTVATLMEFGIPVSTNPKVRTPDDVIKEGAAELGGMFGAKVFAGAMRMKRSFQESLKAAKDSEEFEIYRDPNDGSYYFIDPETGHEVDCDEYGNEVEE
jgi:hypothetical protein